MHDGVDFAVSDHFGDERVPDVGTDELGSAHPPEQILARRDRVDRDDVVDQGVLREPGGQISAQESACPRDQDDLRIVDGVARVGPVRLAPRIHLDRLAAERESYLPSFLRCTRVRRSSLRCFFFDMRLRRFLMTEPMNSATYDCRAFPGAFPSLLTRTPYLGGIGKRKVRARASPRIETVVSARKCEWLTRQL